MRLVEHQERMIVLTHEEIKDIHKERILLQQYCSEPIDAVMFPKLTELLSIIEEEAQKSW